MIDWFVILTPILLLAVVALFGFVGCDAIFGIHSTGLAPPNAEVGYVNTVVYAESATGNGGADIASVDATLTDLQGGEVIVVALQWKGNPPTFSPDLISVAAAYPWMLESAAPPKTMSYIQVFTAMNPANTAQFTVTVQVNSVVAWSVCLSAFNNADTNAPTASPLTQVATTPVSSLQTSPIALAAGDALYGFGLVADGNGDFPSGTNILAAGSGFTLDDPGVMSPPASGDPAPLVEHLTTDNFGSNQSLPAVVLNNTGNPNLFLFGLAIKATAWPGTTMG
jgi:hypothetical protein